MRHEVQTREIPLEIDLLGARTPKFEISEMWPFYITMGELWIPQNRPDLENPPPPDGAPN